MYGNVDFYSVKGIVEKLLGALGIEKTEFVRESESPVFHPGRCAKLLVRKKQAAIFGEVHPDVAENYGMDDKAFIAEIDLKMLYDAAKLDKKYRALPKFPSTSRDIAMLISDDVMVAEIESIISKYGKELIEDIKLFDVYKGKQIPEGLKSVAYSIVYRADNRTLKDEEVNVVHDKIVNALKEKLGAQLR
jgi:phenylalanyl-tRNA synthetase beta chain